MQYEKFKHCILLAHSVKLIGWPEPVKSLHHPNNFGNADLQKVVTLLKTGACRFERMTPEEHTRLEAELDAGKSTTINSTEYILTKLSRSLVFFTELASDVSASVLL
jgi:hypothetical protein